MRHESRVKILFPICFTVISCSHFAFSQGFKAAQPARQPFVLYNAESYKKSISADTCKRLVSLQEFTPQLVTELKYSTKNNFTGQILYKNAAAFMRLPAARALQKVNEELAKKGLGLKVFDAYRPYSATKKMWNLIHDERYVANPAKGSGHNRGASVDLTLINLATKAELKMPTAFDDFTEKSHHNYMNLGKEEIGNRALLKTVMEKHGFVALSTEWWHYSLPNAAARFEILDLDFEVLNELEHKK